MCPFRPCPSPTALRAWAAYAGDLLPDVPLVRVPIAPDSDSDESSTSDDSDLSVLSMDSRPVYPLDAPTAVLRLLGRVIMLRPCRAVFEPRSELRGGGYWLAVDVPMVLRVALDVPPLPVDHSLGCHFRLPYGSHITLATVPAHIAGPHMLAASDRVQRVLSRIAIPADEAFEGLLLAPRYPVRAGDTPILRVDETSPLHRSLDGALRGAWAVLRLPAHDPGYRHSFHLRLGYR